MSSIVIKAALTFAATVCLHVVVWRIRRPIDYAAWVPSLLAIFLIGGGAAAAVLAITLKLPGDELVGAPIVQWCAVMLLQGSIGLGYTVYYTLLLLGSPSLELLKQLARSPEGRRLDEIDLPLTSDALLGPRIANLLESGLIAIESGRLRLAPKGRRLTSCALIYRRTIGLPDGGGG